MTCHSLPVYCLPSRAPRLPSRFAHPLGGVGDPLGAWGLFTILRITVMPPKLNIHSEVKTALEQGKAVVALESTLITHGFPSPENVEIARAMETAVREQGAVPATIAVLKG